MNPFTQPQAGQPAWLLASMLALLSPALQAADLHVCDCGDNSLPACVAGDDGNSGVSPEFPLRSYERARLAFAGLAASDAIRFCRGGAWNVDTTGERWVNAACRAETPCTVGAYTPGWAGDDSPLPWIERRTDQHGFALQDGGNADHEEGYVFEDLHISSNLGEAATASGFLLQNDIDDVLIQRVVIAGFRIGVHLAGSNDCSADPLCDGRNERIVLRDAQVEGNRSFGWLGSSDGSEILDSTFSNNGSLAVFDHNIYISGASDGMRIVGNRLDRATLDAVGRCSAVSLVVHGEQSHLLIENNSVEEALGTANAGCWGIAVDPGYSEAEGFTDVTIRGNRVRNVGRIAIGIASCQRCVIENNLMIQENAAADFDSLGIAAPDRDRAANDLPMDRVTVRNNAIYFGPAAIGVGIRLNGEGEAHLLVSNAIHYAGAGPFSCFDADDLPARYLAMDHNLCFTPSAPGADWVRGVGGLQEWQSAIGFDLHSATLDPGFNDPAAGDLRPASMASAMVDRGDPLYSSAADVSGHPRDADPDIGAWEWVPTEADLIFADGFDSLP